MPVATWWPWKKPSNIIGVQGQLWGETLRNFAQVQYLCFPKMLGLSERAWNASPAWGDHLDDEAAYNDARHQFNLKVGSRELPPAAQPRLITSAWGLRGIRVADGKLLINAQYPGEVVTYTLDGSEPTLDSPRWTAPVALPDVPAVIKARAYYLGHSQRGDLPVQVRTVAARAAVVCSIGRQNLPKCHILTFKLMWVWENVCTFARFFE